MAQHIRIAAANRLERSRQRFEQRNTRSKALPAKQASEKKVSTTHNQRRPGPGKREDTLKAVGYAIAQREYKVSQDEAARLAAERFPVSSARILDLLQEEEKLAEG